MKEIILIKDGELSLKGLNRRNFEDKMVATIRRRLKNLGKVTVERAQSAIYIKPQDDDFDFNSDSFVFICQADSHRVLTANRATTYKP